MIPRFAEPAAANRPRWLHFCRIARAAYLRICTSVQSAKSSEIRVFFLSENERGNMQSELSNQWFGIVVCVVARNMLSILTFVTENEHGPGRHGVQWQFPSFTINCVALDL